jgi:XTP/dITP diphosphohydrolase
MSNDNNKTSIVLATTNKGKLSEYKDLFAKFQWLELELAPDNFEVEETADNFIDNALLKARAAAKLTGKLCLADDSGLCVDALGGRPGLYSNRYCEGDYAYGRQKLLKELDGVENRKAHFICALALVDAKGNVLHKNFCKWHGLIGLEEKGTNGFGFDPIFIPENHEVTAAELAPEEKNRISHRGKSWFNLANYLNSLTIEE